MKKWNEYSLRTQVIIVFGLTQILLFSLIFYFVTINYRDFYLEQVKENLKNNIKLIKNDGSIKNNINNIDQLDEIIKEVGSSIETRITIIDVAGKVLADSRYNPYIMENHSNRPEIKEVIEGTEYGISARKSSTLNQDMYYVASYQNLNGDRVVIRLAKSLENINQIIRGNIYRYLLFLLGLLFLSNLIIWYYSKSIIRPLKRIKKMAKEIATGKSNKIEDVKYSNSELGSLVQEYNRLGQELDSKIDRIMEEKNKLTAILNSMTEGVIATDEKKKILMMNPTACEILNVTCDGIEGKNFLTQIRDHRFDEYLNKVLEKEDNYSMEITFKNPNKLYLECNFQTITDYNDQIIGAVIVLIDVTRLRELEEMRKDFVANVSHELKTPLTSIRGYADTIVENEIQDYDTIKRFVGVISKEATRLNLLINDLLDLSKLESGYFELKPEELDNILDKPLRILQSEAEKKDIEIIKQFDDNLPLVKMNRSQIENLLINLIDNAIKYNEVGGKILIRAYKKNRKVYMEIEDNGMGIPEEDQDRIFERFYRVDKARSKDIGGTGIGLSIVKHIIKGHNSEIEVKTVEDQGTNFKFYLNIAN